MYAFGPLLDPSDLAIISAHENVIKSFQQLDQDVSRLANSIKSQLSLVKGDVVGLWSSNCYHSILIQYACAKLGLIVCTINPAYKSQELEYVLQKAKVKCLFLPGVNSPQESVNKFVEVLSKSQIDRNLLQTLVVIDGDASSSVDLQTLKLSDLISEGDINFDTSFYGNLVADDPAIIM